jgi:hypothetical protein
VVDYIDCTKSTAETVVAAVRKVSALPGIETFLKGFLVESGLPGDITEGGKFPFRSYLHMVSPNEERRTPLWYAAAIVDEFRNARSSFKPTDLESSIKAAFRAGDLYRESAIKFKWDPAVLAHQRVRKGGKSGGSNPKALASKLWIGLLRYTPENPFNIGGHSLYRAAEHLCQDGDDKRIGIEAFRKYVYRIRSSMQKMGK